jgi:putative FmdB family regulatory protein
MPIYEYACQACGIRFEQLILRSDTPECPSCQSRNLERLISLFAVDSDATRTIASAAGRRRSVQNRRDRNDADIAYHRKHDEH